MTARLGPQELGQRAEEMISALARISADEKRLTRLYLTPEHRAAAALVQMWMQEAGLKTRMDSAGTVHGVLSPGKHGTEAARTLFIGSHIDTVIDAGRYDGVLGVVAGILAAEQINARGIDLPFALEILAFGDEEGVRFPVTLTSSSVVAGCFNPSALDAEDRTGTSLRQALIDFGCDPTMLAREARSKKEIIGYLEVHIEQGPVLEALGEPLGVVTAIAGQGRYRVTVSGEAGHAGTVPMHLRRDALAGAAEMIVCVENVARAGSASAMVGTVGDVEATPGAGNVIAGSVSFPVDLRAASDEDRSVAAAEIIESFHAIAERRRLSVRVDQVHEKPVAVCAPRLQEAIAAGVQHVNGTTPHRLLSGAGHDGQAMTNITDIGMMFVRCKAGISHNPLEHASTDDMGLAVEALIRTISIIASRQNP